MPKITQEDGGRITFSKIPDVIEMPYLLETQKQSYNEFLQDDIPPDSRQDKGLQSAFLSVFPITIPGNPSTLEFKEYTLGKQKYDVQECIDRTMTYAAPLKVKVQLIVREVNPETGIINIKDIKEQEIYMGEIPLMTDQGTFIINGAERVIVSQLHRSPGITFSEETHPNGKNIFQARIIPYRGAWVEFEIDIYNTMHVMIDRKRKLPATAFLRAFGCSSDEEILETFFKIEDVDLTGLGKNKVKISKLEENIGSILSEDVINPKTEKLIAKKGTKVTKNLIKNIIKADIKNIAIVEKDEEKELLSKIIARDVVDMETGEVIAEAREKISSQLLAKFHSIGIKKVSLLKVDEGYENDSILCTLDKDKIKTREEALIEIYRRLRPGNPPTLSSGKILLDNLFFNPKRYDLGEVGRYKINKKFGMNHDPETHRTLTKEDIIHVMKRLASLFKGREAVDDIDHLGNRRVRSVGELLQNQIRVGLAEMEKIARERMTILDLEHTLPHNLINAKPITTVIKDFFGRSQLSQFMDQTNPLAELTHKRRLSALGPGGLSRERAGFEVRDVHHTHYGRICPIETPEGPNIGLISSLCTYARINKYGFIETPYRKVKNGKVVDEIEYLTADVEDEYVIAQANVPINEKGEIAEDFTSARHRGDFPKVYANEVHYIDVSPKQLVSVSASLIPFLEHDDANRALMGSNMQRQAVPLLYTEAPIIGTGVEYKTARDSGVTIVARNSGTVKSVTSTEIVIDEDAYPLKKFIRSNQNTCINQKPIAKVGDKVKAGQIIADGPATADGELALGRNVLVAFMPWGGYNFEDAILISERLVKEDVFTSIHIEELEIDARDTKLGKEEITRDIPNVSEDALKMLNDDGIVFIGAEVKPGDILVGKVTPKGETELTSEEKLLRAIFGEKAGDVRDASLKAPPGIYGTVVDIKVFSRKEKGAKIDKEDKSRIAQVQGDKDKKSKELWSKFDKELEELLEKSNKEITNYETGAVLKKADGKVTDKVLNYVKSSLNAGMLPVDGKPGKDVKKLYQETVLKNREYEEDMRNKIDRIKTGDELPPGVIKLVKVYIAKKRKIAVGDKMAGRHGNKGVIAKILPEEDMPYLEDGTPVEIVLNPLGVPSRMNVGQILETHLGWAAKVLGLKIATPIFAGATEKDIKALLKKGNLPESGQTVLYDGLTGDRFDQKITVGYIYMMKLAHLVDDKIHARAIGPYSLVTQQPLGGKAQSGGQRFGEMEVWALEAYGTAYTLQELLTVKSDDVTGRTKIYESIVKGENVLSPGIPESFNVLIKELQGLGLGMELLDSEGLDVAEKEKEKLKSKIFATIAEGTDYFEEEVEEDTEEVAETAEEAEQLPEGLEKEEYQETVEGFEPEEKNLDSVENN